jgi:hypothetical protein
MMYTLVSVPPELLSLIFSNLRSIIRSDFHFQPSSDEQLSEIRSIFSKISLTCSLLFPFAQEHLWHTIQLSKDSPRSLDRIGWFLRTERGRSKLQWIRRLEVLDPLGGGGPIPSTILEERVSISYLTGTLLPALDYLESFSCALESRQFSMRQHKSLDTFKALIFPLLGQKSTLRAISLSYATPLESLEPPNPSIVYLSITGLEIDLVPLLFRSFPNLKSFAAFKCFASRGFPVLRSSAERESSIPWIDEEGFWGRLKELQLEDLIKEEVEELGKSFIASHSLTRIDVID